MTPFFVLDLQQPIRKFTKLLRLPQHIGIPLVQFPCSTAHFRIESLSEFTVVLLGGDRFSRDLALTLLCRFAFD